jgi:hypothetical protein
MPNTLDKFNAGDLRAGINTQTGDFVTEFQLDPESKNLTTGINQGQGPRYGMSPIPAHSNADLIDVVTDVMHERGLRASEAATNQNFYFTDRKKFLGIVPVTIGAYDDLKNKGNMFIWLLSDATTASPILSANANAILDETDPPVYIMPYQFDIANGFTNNLWAQFNPVSYTTLEDWLSPLMNKIAAPNNVPLGTSAADFMQTFLGIEESVFFASTAVLAVTGNKWPQQWLIGQPTGTSTADDTAPANFIAGSINIYNPPTIDSRFCPMGISPSWNIGDWKRNNRDLTFWNISLIPAMSPDDGIRLMRKYVYSSYPVDDGTFISSFNQDMNNSNFVLTKQASLTIDNDALDPYTPNLEVQVLLNDPEGFCDSSYRIALVAAKKPFGFFVQDWQRDGSGRNIQVAPLTDRLQKPFTQTTLAFATASPTYYTEDGVQVSTCFNNWPNFDSTSNLATYPATWTPFPNTHVMLGPADSGILRKNTIYELTYSVFDKQLGIETNVGAPAKIRTGTNDFVAITLYIDGRQAAGPRPWQQYSPASQGTMPVQDSNWAVGANDALAWANYLELRFYYRPLGSYDWLPALFIDATKYWYYPDHQALWACQGNVAGLPGGQPGGFNDYSFLPDDQYTCVVNYKSRAFWFSQNSATFSLRNNPFAYPLRNTAPAPTGGFKGAIVHTYRGQSEQQSRLVIFGQNETYIGKFTGLLEQMPVVVSPGTIVEFPLDGSDFNVETWTSITSFSHRSAVVADGDLYWWGPQGIFKDNGVGNPLRISGNVEPDVFTLYDEALTDEIHCVFDEKVKEIVWFYPPRVANTVSYALRFNVLTQQFFFDQFDCKVDWATRISTNNPGVTQGTNGRRTILSIRENSSATVQRGVFFDQINRSGDYQPTKELLVKSIANGASSLIKVLTLDSGIDATILGNNVALGDYIAFQQYTKYTGTAGVVDFIAKVLSVNTGSKTLTVQLPQGTGLVATSSLITSQFFPIWHAKKLTQGLNGIPWQLMTKYWGPLGPNYSGIWNYGYMLFKYLEWLKIDPVKFSFAYRTPSTNSDYIGDLVEWVNNSDNNAQIMHALRPGNTGSRPGPFGNNQGQAIKLALSGIHIGEEWVLQYLEMQADLESGNILKMYQG